MMPMYHDLQNKVKLTTALVMSLHWSDSLWRMIPAGSVTCQLPAARGSQTPCN